MLHRSYDTWKTTEPEHVGGGQPSGRVAFRHACDGLLLAVIAASMPMDLVEAAFREAEAVWFAKHVAGEARRLGLLS